MTYASFFGTQLYMWRTEDPRKTLQSLGFEYIEIVFMYKHTPYLAFVEDNNITFSANRDLLIEDLLPEDEWPKYEWVLAPLTIWSKVSDPEDPPPFLIEGNMEFVRKMPSEESSVVE